MAGICNSQFLHSVAFIKRDHMLLAGKDKSFFSTFFRKILEVFHKFSGNSLMTVFRDHVQSKYSLDLSVFLMKCDVVIKFIPEVPVYLWSLR